jgi:hypothetical protein
MPSLRASSAHARGALYAKARVLLPEHLNEQEQQLIHDWARLRGVKNIP